MAALNEELLEYQKVDGEYRALEQELSSSEEYKKYAQAKKFLKAAMDKLESQEARAAELRGAKDGLAARCEEMAKSIAEYADLEEMVAEGGGDISFYKKNALVLSERLRAVKGDLGKLMGEIENILAEYNKLKEQVRSMQKQYNENSEKFKALRAGRAAEANAISARLEKIGKEIPAPILEKYKQKRKEKIFPVVVPLQNGCCMCGMDFPLAVQTKLAGGDVIECENCRRFVYKK